MDLLLPQAYLIGLVVLLGGAAVVVTRQILRVRRDESTLARLEGQGVERDAATLYELGSVQLRKRLYGQAVDTLKRALKQVDAEQSPGEARALIANAIGFGLAAQGNYKSAIRHYESALRAKPAYPVALNNFAYALEKQQKLEEACEAYKQALALEPTNKTAQRRLKRLERSQSALKTSLPNPEA
ncbi:tetratricopeptide repeat protein [Synechococcus sp. CS-1328]|uniref:tetratricopeptide repeat protein n=1 Tax=Synechococcus sp. CS-1328 TaxID=2847976 RepID=UPI00223AB945|nr:tetratricopeptide repeat protein [Synechococcus sp. CS-1328]MCT0224943.1 tetratricopeptide repeat protein [Synechococcus sp. CS-1328]